MCVHVSDVCECVVVNACMEAKQDHLSHFLTSIMRAMIPPQQDKVTYTAVALTKKKTEFSISIIIPLM